MSKTDDKLKKAFSTLVEAYNKDDIYKLFPVNILSIGFMPYDRPGLGLMLRGLRADQYRKNPTLKPNEKLLLEIAAKEYPQLTWAELWLKVTGRESEIPKLYTNNTFHRKTRKEVGKLLDHIGGVFCFVWEYGNDFFPKIWPEEYKWWNGLFAGWGIIKNPLGYARKFAPEQPNPLLEEVVDKNIAKSFRELCQCTRDAIKNLNLDKWKVYPLTKESYGDMASSMQAEYTVAYMFGIMSAFMGIPTKARTYSFDVLKSSSKDRWSFAPIKLDDILLVGSHPRVRIKLEPHLPEDYLHHLSNYLKTKRAEGKFKGLHIKLGYFSRLVDIDPIPIGEDDLNPEIWGVKELVGAAIPVEINKEKVPST